MDNALDKIMALINEVDKYDDDIAQSLKESFLGVVTAPARYYEAVIAMIASRELGPEYYEGKDAERRRAHMALTDAINKLNRWAKMYNLEPIFDTGRTTDLNPDVAADRELAAVLGYRFSTELFLGEMANSNRFFDAKTYNEIDSVLYDMEAKSIRFNPEHYTIEDIKKKAEEIRDKENRSHDNRGTGIPASLEGTSR